MQALSAIDLPFPKIVLFLVGKAAYKASPRILLRSSMTSHIYKLLLLVTLAVVTPLSARDNYSLRRALARQDYGSALTITKQEFARARSGGEAANLIRSIIAAAPAEQIPPLVATAVEANPQYGQEVIAAAIEGGSPSERAAIVTSVYFTLSKNPSTPAPLLDYVSALISGGPPTHRVLTTPWFNGGAAVGHLK
jgi:hypothetical protein